MILTVNSNSRSEEWYLWLKTVISELVYKIKTFHAPGLLANACYARTEWPMLCPHNLLILAMPLVAKQPT